MTNSTEAAVFIDTSFFLHYRDLKQIDWCDFAGAKTVHLKVVPTILSEINKNKDTGRTKQIKSRALASSKLLEEVIDSTDPVELRKNVYLGLSPEGYTDYDKYTLDRAIADDRVLLAAIHFRDDNPNISTYIMAGDFGLRGKAKLQQVQAPKPPDEWKIEPAPDPEHKELMELRARVATLPKLELLFLNGTVHSESRRPPPPPNDPSIISQAMAKLRQKYPTHDPTFNPIMQMNEQIVRQYNQLVMQFYQQYEKFLPQWLESEQQRSRTVAIKLELFNKGKSPARDARVRLQFPPGKYELFALGADAPLPPDPPPKLQSFAPMSLGYEPYVDPEPVQPLHHEKDLGLVVVNGSTVEINLTGFKIQHSDSMKLQSFYVQFENYNAMDGVSFNCFVMADEVPETQVQDLSVKVVQGGSSAIWRMPHLD